MDIPILKREEYVREDRSLEHMFSFYDRNQTSAFMVGDPNGEPFVVQLESGHWYAMTILIFAASEEDALNRVRYGVDGLIAAGHNKLQQFLDNEKPSQRNPDQYEDHKEILSSHVQTLMRKREMLDNPEIYNVYPFDKRFVAKVPWASNDNV